MVDRRRALCAEALGTALLVAGVVGSGIMAQRLTHDGAVALLCNAIATGALLTVLIAMFAPLSGAQFNPAVTLAFVVRGEMSVGDGLRYAAAQVLGAIAGTFLAHAMFALPVFAFGVGVRSGAHLWLCEAVATFGLLSVIFALRDRGANLVAPGVGLYIAAAYWFTASTSFANPAATVGRALTPTFAGIRPLDSPMFVVAQVAGALLAAGVASWLFRPPALPTAAQA
ncbi:MAG TPA: MIP/aquaporin family protein [Rhizomicrobium sp.]